MLSVNTLALDNARREVKDERWKVVGEYGHAPKNWEFFRQYLETRLPDFYRKIPTIARISLSFYDSVSASFSHVNSCQCYHDFTCLFLSMIPCFPMVNHGICFHAFPYPVSMIYYSHMVTIDSGFMVSFSV